MEMAVLAILTVTALVIIPEDVPTIPYVSLISISSIKAAHDSLRSGELPQWNPYLGGGFPLAPTPYYLLHALGRTGLIIAILLLSVLVLLLASNVNNMLRVVITLPAVLLSLIIPSPLPLILASYALGFIGNNPLLRTVGSIGIPDVALSIELGIRNPSLPVLLASSACLVDCLVATFGAVPLLTSRPGPIPLLLILLITVVAILPALMALAMLGRIYPDYRWKFSGITAIILFGVQTYLHELPTALATPIILFSLLVLKNFNTHLDRRISVRLNRVSKPLRFLTALMLVLFFIVICSVLATPRFAVVGYKVVGSRTGMEYIISSDPWFSECVKRVLSGHPIWNTPLPTDPHMGPASLLGYELGDPRAVPPLYPTKQLEVQPRVVAPLISSPSSWAETSLHALQLAEAVASRGASVGEPRLNTPTEIRGYGLVGQVYDLWWKGGTHRGLLLQVNGRAVYERPSAWPSVVLTLMSIAVAAIETAKRKSDTV
ncbi:hypothetical protein [Methanopyrus kandleri]|uniref:Uncharacterized protein n=1 Tax=Methanopyrus kandleri TaxID=2320 RepID=A0A832WK66_9EURY|nr:hypothetical protein [Methanopyrus kandleri]HII69860.1 hypothetical protein [Methanopyrus kandleri]